MKVDLQKGSRAHSERYKLDSADGVRLILSDYHEIVGRQYNGDYDAVDLLADLQRAIDKAELTYRQRGALYYVFIKDMTQQQAAKRLGIARQNVADAVNRALDNIAEVYEMWGYFDQIDEEEARK